MTLEQHSALVEQAKRDEALKPRVAAAMAQEFALREAQQRQLGLLFRRFVLHEIWPT